MNRYFSFQNENTNSRIIRAAMSAYNLIQVTNAFYDRAML